MNIPDRRRCQPRLVGAAARSWGAEDQNGSGPPRQGPLSPFWHFLPSPPLGWQPHPSPLATSETGHRESHLRLVQAEPQGCHWLPQCEGHHVRDVFRVLRHPLHRVQGHAQVTHPGRQGLDTATALPQPLEPWPDSHSCCRKNLLHHKLIQKTET